MKRNTSSGLFFVLLSACVGYRAYGLGLGDFSTPGPGFMLFAAAFLLSALGFHLSIASILTKKGPREQQAKGRVWRILPVFLGLLLYIMLFNPLGYLLSTFFFLVILFGMPMGGGRHWLFATGGAAVTAFITYIVFAKFFALSLPGGLLCF